MADNNTFSFESSLKSSDTEEFIDIYFYRPMGYRWALFFNKIGVSPNQITIASIFLGIAAGICYYYDNIWINITGIFLLIWANTYDSADGQLARLTGQKSELGRILDGACGVFWFASIYIAIISRLWPEWSFYILLLALAAGASHGSQTRMADYYRNIHLLFLKGKNGSELDTSKDLEIKYRTTGKKKSWLYRFFDYNYLNYTRGQESWAPHFKEMMKTLQECYAGDAPKWFREEFREQSLPLMKYTNMLSFNLRAIVLFITIICNITWFYFVFELTVMNLMLLYMVRKHEKICKNFTEKLKEENISL